MEIVTENSQPGLAGSVRWSLPVKWHSSLHTCGCRTWHCWDMTKHNQPSLLYCLS